MTIIDNILEDKKKTKIIIVLSLLIFFIGCASVFVSINERDDIVRACNAHWENEVEKEYGHEPNFNIDTPLRFNISL